MCKELAKNIPVAGPSITQKEIDYVTDAVTNAWYENANLYNEKFEKAFAEYIGVKYAISLPSCTSAIHLSLLAFDVSEGDEVIVPDITWIASAAPVSYVGAIPVFADVDEKTWCLSAESFESLITPKTKAVIPVNLYGSMPEMDKIRKIAKEHNIVVIEDAAEAIGSEYKNKKAGSWGNTGVFSFHGSKTMTTGEGGMLVTDDTDIYNRCMFLRDHGRKPGDVMFFNEEVAYKYKMSSMQAALGLAQIERINELVDKKREIFDWYKEELAGMDEVTLNSEPSGTKNSYWMVTAIIDKKLGINKKELMEKMKSKGISTRPFFHPLSSIPAYRGQDEAKKAKERNVVSYEIASCGINLPTGLSMNKVDVINVSRELREIIKAKIDE